MNGVRFFIFNIILLTFFKDSLTVSDYTQEISGDTSEHANSAQSEHSDHQNVVEKNNNSLEKLNSEVTNLKKVVEDLKRLTLNSSNNNHKELILLKFKQLCDAIKYNHKFNIKWLKSEISSFKSHINTQDEKTGDTLLHISIPIKNIKIIKYLINSGADYKIKNQPGLTVLDILKSLNSADKDNKKVIKFFYKNVLKKEELDKKSLLNPTTEKISENKFQELKRKFSKLKNLKFSLSLDE